MEESEIISRCLSGEDEAFEMLVTKYQTSVLGLTWNILRNQEEAKDVTQEAFIQCFLHLNRFDRTKNFKNWLYSIAYKRCLDRKKKEKSSAQYLKKIRKEDKLFKDDKDKKARIEDSEIFSPLLNRLNEKERTVLSLKLNEGYSAKEIARVIGCAESTARVLFYNAKIQLCEMMVFFVLGYYEFLVIVIFLNRLCYPRYLPFSFHPVLIRGI